MFGKILSTLGGVAGNALGGGVFTTIGRFTGRMLGRYLDESLHTPEQYYRHATLRDSLYQISDSAGRAIPLVFGTSRVEGQVIWSKPIRFERIDHHSSRYFEFSGAERSSTHIVEYNYYITCAVAICKGAVAEIGRIWCNNEVIDLSQYKYRIYKGEEGQLPDPLIEANMGIGKTPAFRGLAYIVFDDLPLEDFGGVVPHFSFEVTCIPPIVDGTLEQEIHALNLIPGSGEFVYDTEIIYKQFYVNAQLVESTPINQNNHENIADAVYNFRQLSKLCPHLEWVAPVVCWFGDSLDIAECNIKPRVEYNDSSSASSITWQVGEYNRSIAPLVSRDEYNNPNYGGTINDESLLRYFALLKKNNLKIMLYPMFFMDLPGKPWRGHLTGSPESVTEFFNKDNGYKNFILHYAQLAKGKIDAFIIGSELIGLTKLCHAGSFVAVKELAALACEVKAILGERVVVTYAADWSEYHHTEGGWYNMDELWSCPAIDCVAIDAYFPVTDIKNGAVDSSDIVAGFESGEGYDYYCDGDRTRHKLEPAYAWKNLAYWWENEHINPDGERSSWVPRSKKIWFTEAGFPSIDKATNQPNVFWDPKSLDGGAPRYSTNQVDFPLQRKALTHLLHYWQEKEFIDNIFLWCWDARPYPAWPYSTCWSDGYLWPKGHWLNHKLSACTLASIISALAVSSGIALENIDVTEMHIPISGISFSYQHSFWQAIDLLRCCYFFDIVTCKGQLIFIPRQTTPNYNKVLSFQDSISFVDGAFYQKLKITDNQLINSINLQYIAPLFDYKKDVIYLHNEAGSNKKLHDINIPICLMQNEAEQIASSILFYSRSENFYLSFQLPLQHIGLRPSDVVLYETVDNKLLLRITDVHLDQDMLKIEAVIAHNIPSIVTQLGSTSSLQYMFLNASSASRLDAIYLPLLPFSNIQGGYIHIAYDSENQEDIMAILPGSNGHLVARHSRSTIIAKIIDLTLSSDANPYVIDYISSITFYCKAEFCENADKAILSNSNLLLFGKEIIRFKECHKIADNKYVISELTRGEFATEQYIHSHKPDEELILIDTLHSIQVSKELHGHDLEFYPKNHRKQLNKKLCFSPQDTKPIQPYIIDYTMNDESVLCINWLNRNRYYDNFNAAYCSEYQKLVVELNDQVNSKIEYDSEVNNASIDLSASVFDANIELKLFAVLANGASSEPSIITISI